MAKKPRRDAVRTIIKDLLHSEIPQIQSVAHQLAERIKQLEEHSWKLQDYVSQIENLATEEADAMVESRIQELLKDLDKTLGELKRGPKAAVTSPEVGGVKRKKAEAEEVTKEAEVVEEESKVPQPGVGLVTYTTPEGYVIRKTRH
jgi:hypothetical protein